LTFEPSLLNSTVNDKYRTSCSEIQLSSELLLQRSDVERTLTVQFRSWGQLFALAVLHTFSIKVFQRLALKFPEGSVQENLLHLLGEVEIVFGLWAAFLVAGIALLASGQEAIQYVESRNFTEPIFVFAIMSVAATRPVLDFASGLIGEWRA
jgi:hypothetical protein